jgi:protein O-GlcNAc transferase
MTNIAALFEQAVRHHQNGDLAQAEALYRNIIQADPGHAEALHFLGILAQQTGHPQAAISLIRQAIALKPNVTDFPFNLGVVFKDLGKWSEASACFQAVLGIDPNHREAPNNLGLAFLEEGRLDEAVAVARKALGLYPDNADLHNNLGNAYSQLGQVDEAITCYRAALRLCPHAEIYKNLGMILADIGKLDEAIACYQEARKLEPANPKWHSKIIFTALFHPDYDGRALLEEAQRWNLAHAKPMEKYWRPFDNTPTSNRCLRIGYVSPDFRNHCQSFFTVPLLSAHNRENVQVFCYADVAKPDEITTHLQTKADLWRNIAGQTDEQVAQLIRQDRIDILVDLTMHLAGNRLLVFARKPAPVQVSWLAFPGTTGLSAIDYRLTDPYLDPPALEATDYSERSAWLPDSFWCYDPLSQEPAVNALPALKNGYMTIGSLNNFCKVNTRTLKLWAQVLQKTGTSRLIMLAPEGRHREGVLHLLAQDGIAAERITFVAKQSRARYLELYQQIDLGLDTLPANGHTTSLDSTWMGVPVLTLVGQRVLGRAGVSLLSNLGLPEFICDTPEQFVSSAVKVSGDLHSLSRLRASLRTRMQQSPLMNAARFARNMEDAYRQMWRTWCAAHV